MRGLLEAKEAEERKWVGLFVIDTRCMGETFPSVSIEDRRPRAPRRFYGLEQDAIMNTLRYEILEPQQTRSFHL